MSLLVICSCGVEHEPQPGCGSLCVTCRADAACVADRAELVRLWRKRERYLRTSACVDGIDRQAARVRARIQAQCAAIEPPRAAVLASRQGELALAVINPPSRLVVARG